MSISEANIKNHQQQNDFLNLVKTEIYQCSYCTFTTDKKCSINKHSRVHLAQKRKAMEELYNSNKEMCEVNNDNTIISTINHNINNNKPLIKLKEKKHIDIEKQSENTKVSSSLIINLNDRNQTYCNECEIQFSSLKTFMHHKKHYCQK